jgi:hypothetical protein
VVFVVVVGRFVVVVVVVVVVGCSDVNVDADVPDYYSEEMIPFMFFGCCDDDVETINLFGCGG